MPLFQVFIEHPSYMLYALYVSVSASFSQLKYPHTLTQNVFIFFPCHKIVSIENLYQMRIIWNQHPWSIFSYCLFPFSESATVSEPHFPPVVIQVPMFIDSEPLLPPYSQIDDREPPPAGQPSLPPYTSSAHGGSITNEACVPQSPTPPSDGGPPTYEEAMRIKQLWTTLFSAFLNFRRWISNIRKWIV